MSELEKYKSEIVKKLEEQMAFYNSIAENSELDLKVRQYHKWIGLGIAYSLEAIKESEGK